MTELKNMKVVIRGGGDLATGAAWRLMRCGFRPVVLELPFPRMVRRAVSFGNAVYEGSVTVEGVCARYCGGGIFGGERDYVPVIVDEKGDVLKTLRPEILVDGRMLKKDGVSSLKDARLVIGIGPGFEAGVSAHKVVESNRGSSLGKVYETGRAAADTGIPAVVAGRGGERVLRSPVSGVFHAVKAIGDAVREGETVALVGETPIYAPFDGILRGLMAEGLSVAGGEKTGDVDPRTDADVYSISDKARAIGGGVLEAIFSSLKCSAEFNNFQEV